MYKLVQLVAEFVAKGTPQVKAAIDDVKASTTGLDKAFKQSGQSGGGLQLAMKLASEQAAKFQEDVKKLTDSVKKAFTKGTEQSDFLGPFGGLGAVKDRLAKIGEAVDKGKWGDVSKTKLFSAAAWNLAQSGAAGVGEKMKTFGMEAVKKFEEWGKTAKWAFAGATASITGFVAAASPVAYNTLTGSFKMLAQEIGIAFIPYVMRASEWIQKIATWIRNLSAEQKDNIAKWASIGVAVAGVVAIAPQLIAAFSAIKIAMTAALHHPILAAIAALAAFKVYLDGVTADMDAFADKVTDPTKGKTRKQFEESAEYKEAMKMKAAGSSDEEIAKRMAEIQKNALKEEEKASARVENLQKKKEASWLTLGYQQGDTDLAGAKAAVERASNAADNARLMRQELLGNKFKGAPDSNSKAMLLGGSGMQSAFENLRSTYARIQQAEVNGSSIEAQILRRQVEGNEIARDGVTTLGRVATGVERLKPAVGN